MPTRKFLIVLAVLLLLTNCTAIGLVNDVMAPKYKQKKADSVREDNQPVWIKTTDGREFHGTFVAFQFHEDSLMPVSDLPFLGFGDSLIVKSLAGNTYEGIFRGILHSTKENKLMVQSHWDRNYIHKISLNQIQSIMDKTNRLKYDFPADHNIYVLIQTDSASHSIPLKDLDYLNYRVYKRNNYGLVIGVMADVAVYMVAANMAMNSINLSW